MQPDEYIETRVRQYQDWYDRKPSSSKSRYLRMRGASVVGGSIVPALINVSFTKIVYFQTLVGPYKGLAPADAFRHFIERVETAIASENSATLNTMTVASEATVASDAHRDAAGADDARDHGTRVPAGAAGAAKGEDT